MRRFTLALGVFMTLLGAIPAPAGAQSRSAQRTLTRALSRGLGRIGGASSAYVLDLSTGAPLFSYAAGTGRMPASVEKLYTTSTALERFGATATLTTTVGGMGSLDDSGVFHGTLYLVGGGDPTFGAASFDRSAYGSGATMQRLVSNLIRATGLKAVQGRIVGDESYFDSLRGTPATAYATDLPDVEGELSALAYDRGFANWSGTVAQARPALIAAQQFAIALRAARVKVPSHTPVFTGRTPAGARTLAVVHSPRMARLIALTNTPSDNFFAEMLLKGLGARFGGGGTTAAGVTVVRNELAGQFHLHPRFNDGSGLSRSDATSPLQVVSLLRQLAGNPDFVGSLAVAGRSGTLKDYTQGTAAYANCHGKTGTLHDVANLVGYCQARDGHTLAFAFMANAIGDPLYVHSVEADQMAPALALYDG